MVKQARTIDLAVAIGGDDWVVELKQVLDLSIDGSASTTNEVVLGQADEEASSTLSARPSVSGRSTTATRPTPSDSIAATIATQTPTWR